MARVAEVRLGVPDWAADNPQEEWIEEEIHLGRFVYGFMHLAFSRYLELWGHKTISAEKFRRGIDGTHKATHTASGKIGGFNVNKLAVREGEEWRLLDPEHPPIGRTKRLPPAGVEAARRKALELRRGRKT